MPKNYEIQWRRIIAEGAAIVLSILLAFWIDAWWEERVETNQLVEYLVAIEAELATSEQYIDNRLATTLEQIAAARRLLEMLAGDAANIDSDAFHRYLGSALVFSAGMEGRRNSIDALISSDLYATISNVDLTAALNDYTWRAAALDEQVVFETSSFNATILPMLGRYVDMSSFGWTFYDNVTGPDGEVYQLTVNSPFNFVEPGIESRELWNATYNWMVLLVDRYNLYLSLNKSRSDLRDLVLSEIEALRAPKALYR